FFVALEVHDPLAVGTPLHARAPATTRDRRERRLGRAGARFGNEQLARRLASGVRVAVAHDRDARSVGGPRRSRLVRGRLGQAVELFRRDVEEIDVAVPAGEQISLYVLLELVPVDDDRLGCSRPPAGTAGRTLRRVSGWTRGVRIGVADHEREAPGVRRPLVSLATALPVGA